MESTRIEPALLRTMTVRRILDVLRVHGPASRADITRQTGISAPTVSKAVVTLLDLGLVEEGDVDDRQIGRPARKIQLATDRTQVVGIVLDTLECEVVSAGLDGVLHDEPLIVRTPSSYAALLSSVSDAVEAVAGRTDATLLGIGVSIPGLVNSRTQEAIQSPNLRITNGHFPARDLAEKFGCEAIGMQETSALCLAERAHMKSDVGDFAVLDATTGLGLGTMTNGKLLLGHGGLAGELGHITVNMNGRLCGCGNNGCVETLATDSAFVWYLADRLGANLDFEEAKTLIESGEVNASKELEQTTLYLSVALSAAINLLNPRSLCVNARFLDLQDGLFEHLCELTGRRTLNASFDQCEIRRAQSTKQQAAVAAVVHHLTTDIESLSNATTRSVGF